MSKRCCIRWHHLVTKRFGLDDKLESVERFSDQVRDSNKLEMAVQISGVKMSILCYCVADKHSTKSHVTTQQRRSHSDVRSGAITTSLGTRDVKGVEREWKLGKGVSLPGPLKSLGERRKLLRRSPGQPKTVLVHFQFERTHMIAIQQTVSSIGACLLPPLQWHRRTTGALGHIDVFKPTIGICTVFLMIPQ